MKRVWICFLLFVTGINNNALAQPTDKLATNEEKEGEEVVDGWTKGGTGTINFNQIGFKNWSAGGDNAISLLALLTYKAELRKGNHLWRGQAWADYGLTRIKGQSFRKSADRFEILTKYGYKISDKWYFATLLNTRSQFTNTYNFLNDERQRPFISRFASPLIIEYSVGMDFVPNDIFSLYMSPIAAKFTVVRDDHIKRTYGIVDISDIARRELGALLFANYNHQVHENVNLNSVLKLYKDYLNGPAQNIDVDWQTTIGLKVTKFISASVFVHMIWDYDTDTVPDDTRDVADPDFDASTIGTQRNLQIKDVIGVGLTFNL